MPPQDASLNQSNKNEAEGEVEKKLLTSQPKIALETAVEEKKKMVCS
jgi:hypothetical protein